MSVEREHGDDDLLSASKRLSLGASAPLYDSGMGGILGKTTTKGGDFIPAALTDQCISAGLTFRYETPLPYSSSQTETALRVGHGTGVQ